MTESTNQRPKKPRQKRRWTFVIVALLIGLSLALLVTELAFRMFWTIPPAMAGMGYAGMYTPGEDGTPMLQPGFEGSLRFGKQAPVPVRINNLGMRGRDIGARQPGERRVLVVGDSLPFGYGVDDDQALPACIERALRAAGVPAVVGNGGVPGTGSSHSVARMRLLDRSFAADALVVCGFLGNDAVDDALPQRVVYGGLMHSWPMSQLVQTSWRTQLSFQSRLAMWFEVWVFTNKPEWSPLFAVPPDPQVIERGIGLPPDGKRRAGLFLDARDVNKTWSEGAPPLLPRLLGYLRDSLTQAKQIAGTRPLVFVILPTSWHLDEAKRLRVLKSWDFDPGDYELGLSQRRWRQVAEELGIPVFDATPILRAAGSTKELFIQDGGHLTVRGNEIVGGWLAAELGRLLPN